MRRWSLAILASLFSGFLLLFAVLGWLGTESGGRWLEHRLEVALSGSAGERTQIEGLRLEFPSQISAGIISWADAGGVWLVLEQPRVVLDTAALVRGNLHVRSATATAVRWVRQPTPSTDGTDALAWSDLPKLLVDRLSVGVVEIADSLVRPGYRWTADGSLRWRGPDDFRVMLSAIGGSGPSAETVEFELLRSGAAEPSLRVDVRSPVAGLLEEPGLAAHLKGEGPLGDWSGSLDLTHPQWTVARMALRLSWLATGLELYVAGERIGASGWQVAPVGLHAVLAPAERTDGGWPLRLTLAKTTIRSPTSDSVTLAELELSVRGELHAEGLEQAQVELSTPQWSFEGSGGIADGWTRWAIDGRGDVDLAGFLDGSWQGRSELAVSARGGLEPLDASAEVVASVTDLRSPHERFVRVLGPKPVVKLWASSDGHGLRVSRVELDAPLQIAGQLQIDAGSLLRGDAEAALLDLSRLDPSLAGSLTSSLHLTGSVAEPELSGTAEFEDAAWSARDLGQLSLQAWATMGSGRVVADTRVAAGPVHAALRWTSDDDHTLRLEDCVLVGPQTSLTGAWNVGETGWAAAIRGRIGALESWSELPLAGSVELDLKAEGREAVPSRIEGDVRLSDARLRGESADVAVDALRLEVAIDDPASSDDSIELTATSLSIDDHGVDELTGKFRRDGAQWRMDWNARDEGSVVGSGALDFRWTEAAAGPLLELDVVRSWFDLYGQRLELASTTQLRLSTLRSEVRGLSATVGDGRLEVDTVMAASDLRLELKAVDFPLDAPAAWLGIAVSGSRLSGHASVAGTPSAPEGDVELRVSDIGSGRLASRGIAPMELRLRGQGDKRGWSAGVEVAGLRDSRCDGELRGAWTTAASGMMVAQGMLRCDVDLNEVMVLSAASDDQLAGRIQADLTLGASELAPSVHGAVTIRDGIWESLLSGTRIAGLQAELRCDGDRAHFTRLEGSDGDQGRLNAGGEFTWSWQGLEEVSMNVRVADFDLLRTDDAHARGDAVLHYHGGDAGPRLEGRVDLAEAWIQLPKRYDLQVDTLEITEVRGPSPVPVASGRRTETVSPDIAIDFTVAARRRVFLQGRGLDSEWGGRLRMTGNLTDPQYSGRFDVVRGTADILGKRFRITSGTVELVEGEPELDVRGEVEAREVVAVVRLHGRENRLDVEISSEPPLPRDEVLARVLFGRSAAQLTPMESIELAQSIAELSGYTTGADLLRRFGRMLGVDRISINRGDELAASTLSVGKYLGEDLFLSVEQGIWEDSSRVRVELEVIEHLTLDSEVGLDAQGKVGASWSWEY
jgi:translocation and assembly module TamB